MMTGCNDAGNRKYVYPFTRPRIKAHESYGSYDYEKSISAPRQAVINCVIRFLFPVSHDFAQIH